MAPKTPPENNVQLIVTQTAPFCSPAPVQENRIVLWL